MKEWFDKAEGDWHMAKREVAVVTDPSYDGVCYHAQQCVERLIKGAIIARKVTPPFIHDLVDLSDRLHGLEPAWAWDQTELERLTDGGVKFRYPQASATRQDAEAAFEILTRIRAALVPLL